MPGREIKEVCTRSPHMRRRNHLSIHLFFAFLVYALLFYSITFYSILLYYILVWEVACGMYRCVFYRCVSGAWEIASFCLQSLSIFSSRLFSSFLVYSLISYSNIFEYGRLPVECVGMFFYRCVSVAWVVASFCLQSLSIVSSRPFSSFLVYSLISYSLIF